MAGCMLKGKLEHIGQVMQGVRLNIDFFWNELGMHLTYLNVVYNTKTKLYEVECYFGS